MPGDPHLHSLALPARAGMHAGASVTSFSKKIQLTIYFKLLRKLGLPEWLLSYITGLITSFVIIFLLKERIFVLGV
ncbi:MAG: hypothetical protein ABIJ65_01255 [Chloroflexota bacterium]